MADVLSKRIERVSETILTNEAFTAHFEDDAADLLLKWALKRAEVIASDTIEMDDATAEEAMYPRLKAMRRIAKYLGRLTTGEDDPTELVSKLIEKAHDLYGPEFSIPDPAAQTGFTLLAQDLTPVELIKELIVLFEGQSDETIA